jgi:biopolymer transport protein ExbD
MRSRYLNTNEEAEINITPMLDVVFIMLIFFIVTTTFNKETGLNIFKSSQFVTEPQKTKNAIIQLNTNNVHSVNGIKTSLGGIEPLLANLKAVNPELKAQLVSAKDVEFSDLVQTIQQIKVNGIESYSVSSY